MLQTHLSKTAAQQGWTCNWIQRPLNICCTDLQPICSGCWLLYIGCRSVQQMLRGLWTLKRSSLQMRAVDPLHWAWWSHDKTDLHTQLHGHICSFVCSADNARAASPVTTKAAGADRQSCRCFLLNVYLPLPKDGCPVQVSELPVGACPLWTLVPLHEEPAHSQQDCQKHAKAWSLQKLQEVQGARDRRCKAPHPCGATK